MNKFFVPSVKLMNSLKYSQKFLVISILFLILVTSLMFILLSNVNRQIALSEKELPALKYINPTMELLLDVQNHRGMSCGYLNGVHGFKADLLGIEKKIESDIDKINKLNAKVLKDNRLWIEIKNDWAKINSRSYKDISNISWVEHTKLISKILFFIKYLGKKYHLILDPDVGTSIYFKKMPIFIENVAKIRDLGTCISAKGFFTEASKTELIMYSGIVNYELDLIIDDFPKVFYNMPESENEFDIQIYESKARVKIFMKNTEDFIKKKNIDINSIRYFETGTQAVNSISNVFYKMGKMYKKIILNRIHNLTIYKILLLLLVSIILLITTYFFIGFYFSVICTISTLKEASKQVANGNLEASANIKTKDELASVGATFNEMIEKLSEANQTKKTFLATLVHDMRSPILAEQKALEVILAGKMGLSLNDFKDYLVDIKNINDNNLNLINNILTIYHYESESYQLKSELNSIEEVIDNSVNSLNFLAMSENSELITNIEPDLALVSFDKSEIARVIINLINNAIKHNKKGSKIIISAKKIENDIQVSVKDNGKGISEEDKKFIFQKYPTKKRAMGTGLGLYLVKQIISAHGGKVWFESEVDKGSTFYFSLPLFKGK